MKSFVFFVSFNAFCQRLYFTKKIIIIAIIIIIIILIIIIIIIKKKGFTEVDYNYKLNSCEMNVLNNTIIFFNPVNCRCYESEQGCLKYD